MPRVSQSETFSPDGDNANCRESVAAAPTQSDLSPFDPANLRLDPEYLKSGGVRKLLTTVPVGRPNKQDFIRVHPDPAYRLCGVATIEFREERETYLVVSSFAQGLDPQYFNCSNLYLAINRQKVIFLWRTKLANPGGHISRWHSSGVEAAEKAMTHWIRVVANMSLGAYEIFAAESQLSDPEWPSLPFHDILEIAFKDRLIEDHDHPAMQRLRGTI